MDLSSIRLTRDQVELLVTLVDAFRRAPKKEPFWLLRHGQGDDLIHPGLQDDFEVYFGDLEALRDAGILRLSRIRQSSRQYDISPLGFDYYDHVLSERGEDISSIEVLTAEYIQASQFRGRHPEASRKWAMATDAVRTHESTRQVTTVGHLCREAMQAFAEDLAVEAGLASDLPKREQTLNRIEAVLKGVKKSIGRTHADSLTALMGLWKAANDVVQRQEHGAAREGESVTWMDARRCVFLTAVGMHELDTAVLESRSGG